MVHKRVKYLRPVSGCSKYFGVIVRKKCVQKCLFFNLVTNAPPVNDNEQGPSGGALRKIDIIFIEIFCYHVNRLLVCFLKYLPNKTPIFKKKEIFGPNFPPPDVQCRCLLEVKQMPQRVVSSELLTTHKV